MRPDSIFAGSVAGLYRSHDGGKTLVLDLSDESLVVNTIALHPQRPGRVILGVEGDGVYVSNDNAKTFTRTCDGLRNLTITSIAADASQPKNVYAAVAFGGASSGIYRSTDAGTTWKKLPTNDLPQVLSLVITEDAEVKFVAGTEKGFFWSSDGEQWTQAPPASFPIRVDKVLRFNKVALLRRDLGGRLHQPRRRQELVPPRRRRQPRRRHRHRQPRRNARSSR